MAYIKFDEVSNCRNHRSGPFCVFDAYDLVLSTSVDNYWNVRDSVYRDERWPKLIVEPCVADVIPDVIIEVLEVLLCYYLAEVIQKFG